LPLAAMLVAGLAGCGGVSADLFAVERSGSVPGAALSMIVRDDGMVRCNGVQHKLPDALLIDSRKLQRDLSRPATEGVSLPPGPQPVFSYAVRTPAGRFSFADDSPGKPLPLFRLAALVHDVAKRVCRLAR
jgi:hypothetical protein